ncbi:hypothetical protein CDAR_480511 [Caerostris darwini]|uniref:Uncharacterized protein n=1 Tax=Caerostris darwini TaxID=1538125 RepID=A0AAV4V1X2_9ARAC|nr:hypothetical protein CDAR_480511 [Caerostris darwini]
MAPLKTHKRNNEFLLVPPVDSLPSEINCLWGYKWRATAGKPINILETSCFKKRNGLRVFSRLRGKKLRLSLIELDDPSIEREDLYFTLVTYKDNIFEEWKLSILFQLKEKSCGLVWQYV